MKKVFTFAVTLFAFTSMAFAGQRDTTQANQPVDLFEGMPRFQITDMHGDPTAAKGIVLQCPIKRYKNEPTKYVWNEKGFDVVVRIAHIPHNGYPGFDNVEQTEFIPFNLKNKMDAQKGAGYFIDGVAGEWQDDPINPKLQIYHYTGYPAVVTISMKSRLDDYRTNQFSIGWRFDGNDDYWVEHEVHLRIKNQQ